MNQLTVRIDKTIAIIFFTVSSTSSRISSALSALKSDFVLAYSNPYVARWSLWWALAMCGNFQVILIDWRTV